MVRWMRRRGGGFIMRGLRVLEGSEGLSEGNFTEDGWLSGGMSGGAVEVSRGTHAVLMAS